MKDDWLDKVALGVRVYNETRLHTNFQEEETLKFVEWLHKMYGRQYTKPTATHQNTPEHLAQTQQRLKAQHDSRTRQ
jgi:hypothetical protein